MIKELGGTAMYQTPLKNGSEGWIFQRTLSCFLPIRKSRAVVCETVQIYSIIISTKTGDPFLSLVDLLKRVGWQRPGPK